MLGGGARKWGGGSVGRGGVVMSLARGGEERKEVRLGGGRWDIDKPI